MRRRRMPLTKPILIVCVAIAACSRRAGIPPSLPLPPPPAQSMAPKPKQNFIVLLPDEAGKPSGITVSNQGGARELGQPYDAVRLENAVDMPADLIKMDQAEVKRRWGAEIDAVPLGPVQFNLYFVQAKDDLTPESAAMIPDVLRAIRERRSTDISLIGHTDTTDDDAANYRLGLQRAQRMADLLRSNGVDPTSLTTTSHGERDLLVRTPDGVAEPRNRRVEISVR